MSQEREEFASSRYWKSPNTLDEEVPPALDENPVENERRIREIVESDAAAEADQAAAQADTAPGSADSVDPDTAERRAQPG